MGHHVGESMGPSQKLHPGWVNNVNVEAGRTGTAEAPEGY